MSRGPGRRQRAILNALERGDGRAAWVVPNGVNRCEAVAWRRAARALTLKGQVRAVYFRKPDRSGRSVAHLAVTLPECDLLGDVRPLGSPNWVEVAPPYVTSFNVTLQAALIAHITGRPCSPRSATRRAAEWLDALRELLDQDDIEQLDHIDGADCEATFTACPLAG